MEEEKTELEFDKDPEYDIDEFTKEMNYFSVSFGYFFVYIDGEIVMNDGKETVYLMSRAQIQDTPCGSMLVLEDIMDDRIFITAHPALAAFIFIGSYISMSEAEEILSEKSKD